MINADMRVYDYLTYGDADRYGQPQLSKEVKGNVKMSINVISQSIQDSVLYKDASYIGLTHDSTIDDTFVIKYGDERLKVLYVNPKGRYKQIFLKRI